MLDSGDIASMCVAIIAAFGAWAAHRTSSKANVTTSRNSVEEQAYVRARKFDLDTIERQEEELKQLRPLVHEVQILRARVNRLESLLPRSEQVIDNGQQDIDIPLPPR